MSMNEVIIHHLDATCGTTCRISGRLFRGMQWKSQDLHEVTSTDDRDHRTHPMLSKPETCYREMKRGFRWPANLDFASPIDRHRDTRRSTASSPGSPVRHGQGIHSTMHTFVGRPVIDVSHPPPLPPSAVRAQPPPPSLTFLFLSQPVMDLSLDLDRDRNVIERLSRLYSLMPRLLIRSSLSGLLC